MNTIRKYENHLSIIKIKSPVETTQLFDLNFVNSDNISRIINSLDPTKKTSSVIYSNQNSEETKFVRTWQIALMDV